MAEKLSLTSFDSVTVYGCTTAWKWVRVLAVAVCLAHSGLCYGSTPADRLLQHASSGSTGSAAWVKLQAFSVLADLGASSGLRDQFSLMDKWHVVAKRGPVHSDDVDHSILIAQGPVVLKRAFYSVIQ